MSLARIEPDEPDDLTTLSLDGLAIRLRHEHAEAERHLSRGLIHAIRAGRILVEARTRVPDGGWCKWLEGAGISEGRASLLMRAAIHEETLLARGVASMSGLPQALRGLPSGFKAGTSGYPGEMREEAMRLRRAGMTIAEITEALSVSDNTTRRWVDPDTRRRQNATKAKAKRRRNAASAALREKERNDARKALGGDASKAYEQVRKLSLLVDGLWRDAKDSEERELLRGVVSNLAKVANDLDKAWRLS